MQKLRIPPSEFCPSKAGCVINVTGQKLQNYKSNIKIYKIKKRINKLVHL